MLSWRIPLSLRVCMWAGNDRETEEETSETKKTRPTRRPQRIVEFFDKEASH